MSPMIVLAGTAEFATRAGRDEGVAASAPFQAPARNDEPGCLAYYFAADPVNDTRMVVYELWADEASLAAHFKHKNYFDMRDNMAKYGVVSAKFKKYRVDHSEPVYDDTGTPRADFFSLNV